MFLSFLSSMDGFVGSSRESSILYSWKNSILWHFFYAETGSNQGKFVVSGIFQQKNAPVFSHVPNTNVKDMNPAVHKLQNPRLVLVVSWDWRSIILMFNVFGPRWVPHRRMGRSAKVFQQMLHMHKLCSATSWYVQQSWGMLRPFHSTNWTSFSFFCCGTQHTVSSWFLNTGPTKGSTSRMQVVHHLCKTFARQAPRVCAPVLALNANPSPWWFNPSLDFVKNVGCFCVFVVLFERKKIAGIILNACGFGIWSCMYI